LFLESNINGDCPMFPGTSVAELVAYGVTLDKLVVGKITETYDGGNGYVAPPTLNQYFATAKQQLGWDVGIAAYCWSLRDSATWIAGVYPAAGSGGGSGGGGGGGGGLRGVAVGRRRQ